MAVRMIINKYTSLAKQKLLKDVIATLSLIQRHLVTCSFNQIKSQHFLILFAVLVFLLEADVLCLQRHWLGRTVLLQTHLIDVLVGVGERNNVVPISTEQVNPQPAFQELRDSEIASHWVVFVVQVNGHVAFSDRSICFDGFEELTIGIDVVLHSLIIRTPLSSLQLPCLRSVSLGKMMIFAEFQTQIGHECTLRRAFPAIAHPIDIVLVYPIQQIFVSFVEITAARRRSICLAGTLPIWHQPRVYKIVRDHELHTTVLQFLETVDSVCDQQALQIDLHRRFISIVPENLHSQVRNHLASIRLTSNIESISAVLCKLPREEVLQGLKRVPRSSFISIYVIGICVDAVAGACGCIDKEQVGLIAPTIGIHCELFLSIVGLSFLQHIRSNLLNKSYE